MLGANVTRDGKRLVYVAFYCKDEDPRVSASCLDSVAKCYLPAAQNARTYTHVEMRFSNHRVTSVARDPGHVYLVEEKMLSNVGYRGFFRIALTQSEEEELLDMARVAAATRVPFNERAMWWNFAPLTAWFPVRAGGQAYFCSEYMATLLQRVLPADDPVHALDPARTSPNALYNALCESPHAHLDFNRALSALKGTHKKQPERVLMKTRLKEK